MMKPTKNSVAFVIYNKNHTRFIAVKRPSDDESLPNVWGLPAGSLKENESFEGAVLRSGMEKLGVKLKIIKLLNEGKIKRETYTLFMKEFEVEIIEGEPLVPQPYEGITQYKQWKWATSSDLIEAAQRGSLCSRLFLKSINHNW